MILIPEVLGEGGCPGLMKLGPGVILDAVLWVGWIELRMVGGSMRDTMMLDGIGLVGVDRPPKPAGILVGVVTGELFEV